MSAFDHNSREVEHFFNNIRKPQINLGAARHAATKKGNFATFLSTLKKNLICCSVNKPKLGIRRIVRKHLPSEEGVPSLSKGEKERERGERRTLNLIRIRALREARERGF